MTSLAFSSRAQVHYYEALFTRSRDLERLIHILGLPVEGPVEPEPGLDPGRLFDVAGIALKSGGPYFNWGMIVLTLVILPNKLERAVQIKKNS